MSRAREFLNEVMVKQLKGSNSWALDILLKRNIDLSDLKNKIFRQIEAEIEKELPLDKIEDYGASMSSGLSVLQLTLLFHRNVEGKAIDRIVKGIVEGKYNLYPWKI